MHVAVESNGLPVSIVTSPANIHDSTRFTDVMKGISDFLDDKSIRQIISVYADKGYDSASIRNYLKNKNIVPCIPKRNFKKNDNEKYSDVNQINYNKTRYVVWNGSLHGSRMDFTEPGSDMKRTVTIILDLFTWHQF